jgi:hypothetical protein
LERWPKRRYSRMARFGRVAHFHGSRNRCSSWPGNGGLAEQLVVAAGQLVTWVGSRLGLGCRRCSRGRGARAQAGPRPAVTGRVHARVGVGVARAWPAARECGRRRWCRRCGPRSRVHRRESALRRDPSAADALEAGWDGKCGHAGETPRGRGSDVTCDGERVGSCALVMRVIEEQRPGADARDREGVFGGRRRVGRTGRRRVRHRGGDCVSR